MEIKKFGPQAQVQTQAQTEGNPTEPISTPLSNPKKLPENVISMINERIGDEYTAYYFYTNATNWCKDKNYKKAAAFFQAEAQSELEHSKGLQDYLTQWNILPELPQVPTNQTFETLVDIINKAYSVEYNLLLKYSKDQQILLGVHSATFNFIQKYVDIQNESVEEYSDLLNALHLVKWTNKFEVLYFEQTYF
jgi:ferritin